MSCRAARSGCPPTARARFVHLAGRNGRCGSTPMETSVLMQCRWQGSADVIAADSPARSPISSLGGNNRSSDNSWSALERVPWCRSGPRKGSCSWYRARHVDIVEAGGSRCGDCRGSRVDRLRRRARYLLQMSQTSRLRRGDTQRNLTSAACFAFRQCPPSRYGGL